MLFRFADRASRRYALAIPHKDGGGDIVVVSAFPEIPLMAQNHLVKRFYQAMDCYTTYEKRNGRWIPHDLRKDPDFRVHSGSSVMLDFSDMLKIDLKTIQPTTRKRKELVV